MISEERRKKRNRHGNIHSLLALVRHGCSAAAVTATLSLASSNKVREEATRVYENICSKDQRKRKRGRKEIKKGALEQLSYVK